MEQNPYAAPSVDPTASALAAQADGPRDWTIGQVLGFGWETTKSNLVPLVGGFTGVIIIQQVAQSLLQSALGMSPEPNPSDPLAALAGGLAFMPIAMLMGIYFTIGQFRVALAAARGEEFNFGLFFSGYDRLLPGILLTIIMYFAIAVGMVFLVIPGIIVALGLSMVIPLLADTKAGVGEILSESWNTTKGQKMHIFGLYFACIGVALLGVLALFVGVLVAIPVIMVAFAEVYMCVTGRRTAQD